MRRRLAPVALLSLIAAHGVAAEQATITVTDQVVRRGLSPIEFCGVNWEYTGSQHTLRHIWRNCYKEFIDFLRANRIHTFRYPGGGYVTHFHPGVRSQAWHGQLDSKVRPVYRPDDWIEYGEFLTFLADGDFRAIIQLNTLTVFDPQTQSVRPVLSDDGRLSREALDLAVEAAAWAVRYAKERGLSKYIAHWEIGNEDYFVYAPQQYGRIACKFLEAVRKVDSDAHILVTTQWSFPSAPREGRRLEWSAGVLRYLARRGVHNENITFVNHEYAWSMTGTDHTAYDEWRRYAGTNPTHRYEQPWGKLPCAPYELLFRAYDDNGFPGAAVYVTEFRYGWMTNLYNKSLASGVANVNLVMHYLKHPRIRGCVFHSLLHGSHVDESIERPFTSWGFNMVEYTPTPSTPHNFASTPISQGYRLIDRFCHGDLLTADSSTWNLNVAAAREGHHLRLLVVNRTRDDEQTAETSSVTASVVLPAGWRVTAASAYVLTSDTLADSSAELGTYDGVHEILVRRQEVHVPANGDLSLRFPPHSATLVELAVGEPA